MGLSESGVELWFACPDEWDDAALSVAVQGCLDAGEIARMERQRATEGRRLFAVSHLLVRQALAYHGGRPADEWRFVDTGYGKPAIDPGLGVTGLHFNLAHTRGMAVVAVTRLGEVGIDIERTDRRVDARGLIRRFFAPSETAVLEALPPEELQKRFIIHWTFKEAALKAAGRGLSLPLNSVAFSLSGQRPYRIAIGGEGRANATQGHFAMVEPGNPYLTAVCVNCDLDASVRISARQLLPSGATEPLTYAPIAFSPGGGLTEG